MVISGGVCYTGQENKSAGIAGMEEIMDPILYMVRKIDGDYAWLENIDHPEREPVFIARALLPDTIFEGARLLFKNFEYTQL